LEREDPRDRARLRGPVFGENALAGTITILNVQVSGEPNITEYQDSNDAVISQQEFICRLRRVILSRLFGIFS
jgi:hypothetical protein